MSRRSQLVLTTAVLLLREGMAFGAPAEVFPSRPIDIVTHASPGGGTDTTARTLLIGAREALGVDMAVVPRVGGGGLVAMSYMSTRPKDGYTLMGITPTHLYAIARGQGPLKIEDLVGVARATDDPIVVMVRSKGRENIRSLDDLIALGKKRPIKWGTTQIGGVDHIAGAMLGEEAGTKVSVVPFGGGGEVVTNLLGGNIDAAGLNLTEGLDAVRRGDFRPLAVMAERRMDAIADVPTTVELGYDVRFSTVRGYVVLRGTPEDRIEALELGLLTGMKHTAFQDYLKGSGLDAASVAGQEVWNAQIQRIYRQGLEAMTSLGIIR